MASIHQDGPRLIVQLNDSEAFTLFQIEKAEGVPVWSLKKFFMRRHFVKLGLLEVREPAGNTRRLHVLTPLARAYMTQIHQKVRDMHDDLF